MKIFCKIAIVIIFILIILSIYVSNYFIIQQDNEEHTRLCNEKNENFIDLVPQLNSSNNNLIGVINEPNSCYCRMYTHLLPRLLVYKVRHDNQDLKFIRPSRRTYIVPTLVLEKADAFISYGRINDIDFEYVISELYKKNLYLFDCGTKSISKKNQYIFFENECIETDGYVTQMDKISTGKTHTFKEKLKELKLTNKKIYLKIDIADAALVVLPNILKHYRNITGITLDIVLSNSNNIIKYESLLKEIEKNFVLVARNEGPIKKHCDCKYKNNYMSPIISLTYINKEYVDKKYLPLKQSYNKQTDYKQLYFPGFCLFEFDISWQLILSEKIKSFFGEF